MRWYLTHAAMLLLGVTLAVGFYEGRRLVKNTAKALGAGTVVSSASARRTEAQELRERLENAEQRIAERRAARSERTAAGANDEDRTRRRARAGTGRAGDGEGLSRADRLELVRERRERLQAGRPLAVPPEVLDGGPALEAGLEEPLVDTALPPP